MSDQDAGAGQRGYDASLSENDKLEKKKASALTSADVTSATSWHRLMRSRTLSFSYNTPSLRSTLGRLGHGPRNLATATAVDASGVRRNRDAGL